MFHVEHNLDNRMFHRTQKRPIEGAFGHHSA
jgi:hypothetical protein